MKTVKIKFVGFWDDFDPQYNIIYRILEKFYNVVVCDDPDYIICSMFGTPYEYCKYPQVRIMYSGENYIPDFNLIDYAVCCYPLSFFDRVGYRPGCIDPFDHCSKLNKKSRDYSVEWLNEKKYFANFISSHESEYGIRGDFFKELSKYKRVESPGKYLNNMTEDVQISWTDESKINFQRKCKFTLCFESTKHEGFVTEKITDAFYADTVPVYFGSSTVSEIFNPNAFIECLGRDNFDATINKIIELDRNDDLYLNMMRQPIFTDASFYEKTIKKLEDFIVNIFEQPLEEAYRRSRVYMPQKHNDYLLIAKPIPNYTKTDLFKMLVRKFFPK